LQFNITIKKLDDGSYLIHYDHGLLGRKGQASSRNKEELGKFMETLVLKEA
jgi:hypothetical protein